MSTRLEMAQDGREAAAQALLGKDKTAEQMGLEDYESGLVDALTNLMHFADRYHLDFEQQLGRAYGHHAAEKEFGWEEETA
jgi:hypothetical protein